MNFMRDVLAFCDKTSQETEVNIATINTELEKAVEKEQFDNVQATVIQNNTLRSQELQRRKNKKFYALKYKKDTPRNRGTFDQAQDVDQRDPDTHQHGIRNNERIDHQNQRATGARQHQGWSNQQGRSYANAVSEGSRHHQQNPPLRVRSRHNLSRQDSRNDINKEAPLHQQISLQRKRSF